MVSNDKLMLLKVFYFLHTQTHTHRLGATQSKVCTRRAATEKHRAHICICIFARSKDSRNFETKKNAQQYCTRLILQCSNKRVRGIFIYGRHDETARCSFATHISLMHNARARDDMKMYKSIFSA